MEGFSIESAKSVVHQSGVTGKPYRRDTNFVLNISFAQLLLPALRFENELSHRHDHDAVVRLAEGSRGGEASRGARSAGAPAPGARGGGGGGGGRGGGGGEPGGRDGPGRRARERKQTNYNVARNSSRRRCAARASAHARGADRRSALNNAKEIAFAENFAQLADMNLTLNRKSSLHVRRREGGVSLLSPLNISEYGILVLYLR